MMEPEAVPTTAAADALAGLWSEAAQKLVDLGSCNLCALRITAGHRADAVYSAGDVESTTTPTQQEQQQQPTQRRRCPLCLGLLQQDHSEGAVISDDSSTTSAASATLQSIAAECNAAMQASGQTAVQTFALSITLPGSLSVRQTAFYLAHQDLQPPGTAALEVKEVLRLMLAAELRRQHGGVYSTDSEVVLAIQISAPTADQEIAELLGLAKPRQQRK